MAKLFLAVVMTLSYAVTAHCGEYHGGIVFGGLVIVAMPGKYKDYRRVSVRDSITGRQYEAVWDLKSRMSPDINLPVKLIDTLGYHNLAREAEPEEVFVVGPVEDGDMLQSSKSAGEL